ncbi:type II CRISPR-associated endonuclease Cas1 [Enterococcus dispar]|jgi:CRISPR-associated protein Cas1|uniref:CRISPR-associated endonuclease Cas1 n=1 Tax=Enterococcus dispar ATCC 51266 TaxID=1139219 RepID=S0K6U8_9ENTE|nr:type II CRISPR-associated endonuclease Cas1 [Enterococcus dispar]EOT40739.1 CRISPR-associated endonuclease cas1 [Enterococcus dispar ATCC 51266]EOW86888.1 CRISPR-associated endonuclease cas1 [Enterococcus dispar ATCC 51266]OJG39831.1 CRISPR-associated endonuclease cas1 [Enterococcus dispar]
MTWRIVHIKESDSLNLKLDNLEILKKGQKYHIPLADISMVIIESNATITTNLLARFSKYNIALIVCDNKYLPTGLFLNYGNYHRCGKRSQEQLTWDDAIKQLMWQNIVGQKISNQIQFAKYKGIDDNRLDIMIGMYQQLKPGDETNREGHVAKVYFNSLYGMEFTRDTDDLANIAMNYGYAVIRAAIARLTVGQGLMTMLGVFHCNEYNSFNLVDDLMEPFRPLMDYWIDKEILSQFNYLSYQSRLKIIEFLHQPMQYKSTKSTVDQVMLKYVNSFVKAMNDRNEKAIHNIALNDFIEVGR